MGGWNVKRVILLLVAGMLVAGVVMTATAAPKAQKVTLSLTEFKFSPAAVTVQAGVPVELTLVNKGSVQHEFMLYTMPKGLAPGTNMDEYAINNTYFKDIDEVVVEFADTGMVAAPVVFETEVKPKKSVTVKFTPTKKGTFEMGCHVEGHYEAGMKGTLTVK